MLIKKFLSKGGGGALFREGHSLEQIRQCKKMISYSKQLEFDFKKLPSLS